MTQRIRAITLDLDETLWPLAPAIERAEKLTMAWIGERTPAFTARWTVETLRELRMGVFQANQHLRHDILGLRRMAMAMAFDEAGIGANEAAPVIDGAIEVFMTARNDVQPFADVLDCLERLASRFPLATLSNGNADIFKMPMGRHFKAAISAQTHGASKPDAGIFHAACRALDCTPGEVVHLGDDADLDVRGALAAGLQAVWINRHGKAWAGEDQPHIVTDLVEFEQWVMRNA
jgi:2-haloalkanoic acid dehalogenase type II